MASCVTRLVISFSSCFAGGVFIAACLLDLMPDVEEGFAEVLKKIKDQYKVDLDYPVAQFVIVFGFFVILTIEQTVLHFQEQWALDAEREPLLSRRRRPSAGSTSSYSSTQGHSHHHHQHRGELVQGVSNEVHQEHDGHSHGHSHAVFNHSSMSLGLNIAQSDLSVKAFVWSNVLFSLSSPVGVAIGGLIPVINNFINVTNSRHCSL